MVSLWSDFLMQISFQICKDTSNQKTLSGNEVAEHLDLLMVFIFEHLKFCYDSGRLDQVPFCEALCSLNKDCFSWWFAKFHVDKYTKSYVCRYLKCFSSHSRGLC